jgi:hypothetical protein
MAARITAIREYQPFAGNRKQPFNRKQPLRYHGIARNRMARITAIRRKQPFAGNWKQPSRYCRYYRDRYRELMVACFLDHCSLISFFALVVADAARLIVINPTHHDRFRLNPPASP